MSNLKVLCFLDVLGFKNLFIRLGLDEINNKYSRLIEYVNSQKGGIDIVPTASGHVAVGWLVIGSAYFSDTLLFWSDYNKMMLPSFISLIQETICYGLEHELPLRGTLSVGEAILDNNDRIYLGNPLIECAETERTQQWIGVSFGPSFMKDDRNQGFHLDAVLPYKSHYKDSADALVTGMVIDWPRRWRNTRSTDLRTKIAGLNTDPLFSKYYDATLKFIDFSEQNHDWFTKASHLSYG
jgi:hypothetical protein